MTKSGLSFILIGVFTYFLASQTQIGWLYLFDAIIWSLLLLSAILPWYSLKSLKVERRILLSTPSPGQWQLGGPLEDETVEVRLKVTNSGRFSRDLIRVREDCPFEEPGKRQKSFFIASLGPKSSTSFSYHARCHKRGYYAASNAILQSGGPLGWFRSRRTFQLPLNLTVLPEYYHMEGLPPADLSWAELGQAVRSDAPAEVYGSREYRYGDPLRHIHWRNTARLGHFMVKEFEQSSRDPVAVIFETGHEFGMGRETTLEYSIKVAASLSRLCADSGRNIDIIAGKAPLTGADWQEAMNYLARLETGEGVTLAGLAAAPISGRVTVAVVPAVESDLIPALLRLASRVRSLVVVLLEGFAPGESPAEFRSRLGGSKIDIIFCPRGNLESAIEKLGGSLSSAGNLPASAG